MNITTKTKINQADGIKENAVGTNAPRTRRRAGNAKASSVFTDDRTSEEMKAKEAGIRTNLKAITWKETEAKGKFKKNEKIGLIDDSTLIVGCDVGS